MSYEKGTVGHLIDGFGEEAIKDGIVLCGERIDCDKRAGMSTSL